MTALPLLVFDTNILMEMLVTRDTDFQVQELLEELDGLGFKISKDPLKLYQQLRSA